MKHFRTLTVPAVFVFACDAPVEGIVPEETAGESEESSVDLPGDDTTPSDEEQDEEPESGGSDGQPTDDEGDTPGEQEDVDPTDARIRVVHASADAPPVDVYVEGSADPIIQGLAYGETSSYLTVPRGDYAFDIRAAGTPPDSSPAFTTPALTLEGGTTVSTVAAGLLRSDDSNDTFRVLAFVEGFDAAGADNSAFVRVVHAGPDAPTVDLDVGDDGSPELTSLERFADTGESGVALPASATLQIGVRLAGGERVTAFTTPELPDGGELFVIATGLLSDLPRQDSGFSLLAVGPQGSIGFIRQNPSVYALHAGPDAPAVDICTDGSPLLEGVSFGDLGQVQVPPGAYDLDFFVAPSGCQGDPAYSQATPALESGQRILAIAAGELAPEGDDSEFAVQAYVEDFALDRPDEGVFSVIHAASAPAVDVGLVQGGVIDADDRLIRDLTFSDQSDRFSAAPATYAFGIALAGGHPPLHPLAAFHVPIEAGDRAFVVAPGSLQTGEAPFRLFVIPTQTPQWSAIQFAAN